MKKSIKTLMALLVIAVLFTNCKKAEQGKKGDQGLPGNTGNANVKSKTVDSHTWVYTAPQYASTCYFPEITQNVIDYGCVTVAMENGSNTWVPLPITIIYSNYTAIVDYEYFLGGVRINIANTLLQQPSLPPNNLKFKRTSIAGTPMIKPLPTVIKLPTVQIGNPVN